MRSPEATPTGVDRNLPNLSSGSECHPGNDEQKREGGNAPVSCHGFRAFDFSTYMPNNVDCGDWLFHLARHSSETQFTAGREVWRRQACLDLRSKICSDASSKKGGSQTPIPGPDFRGLFAAESPPSR